MAPPDPERPSRRRTRDNGDGSAYQTGDGRWRGSITIGFGPDGRQRRRYVSGATRREVLARLAEARDQRDAGVDVTRTTTVADWLEHWLTTIAARTVRPSTLEGYTTAVRVWATPAVGRKRLDRLTPDDLERLYADMLDAGRSVGTVRATHRALARALQVATERGRIARNPARLVHLPEVDAKEIEAFTEEEARAILAAAEGTWNAARWSVALAIGLRQGEALGLSWEHVDFDKGMVRVRHALQRITGHGLQLVPVKSRAGRRNIALPPALAQALREHRQQQRVARLEDGPRWTGWRTRVLHPGGPEHDVELVFAQRSGRPIDTRADHRDWEALLVSAGVRDARLHDARHTAATLLLEQGVPARVVMEILGHSQISLTLGTYSHVTSRLAGEAAAAMEGALWGAAPAEPAPRARGRRTS